MLDSPIAPASAASPALANYSALELAQALAAQLSITDRDWHRLKANRIARSQEQAANAIVLLLKDQPEAALLHLQQASGWLDRSISAPPCEHKQKGA
jgi:Family of unknown function (DUF6439)